MRPSQWTKNLVTFAGLIEDTGFVKRLIPDDNDGSRHQRFVLQLSDRQTLLMAHNIDLAQRVPVRIHLDEVPEEIKLRVGTTASVLVMTDESK